MIRQCALVLALPLVALGQLAEFEAKQVTVKIDMPATQMGVDVFPQRGEPLDLKSYQRRLKQFGTAVRAGDSILVTRVKVKDKLIEFHLGGGGYGTLGDETGTVTATSASKTSREKDLENRIRNESDANRRRSMEQEVDMLRRDRERQDSRARAIAVEANEIKQQRIASKRLEGGSRFNIKFENTVPAEAVTPEMVRRALAEYVSFDAMPRQSRSNGASGVSIEKGMTRAQVEGRLGPADKATTKDHDGLKRTVCVYTSGESMVEAEFVNDVLVRFTIASR